MNFILASASERRQELLKRILSEFTIKVSQFDEELIPYDGDPRSYVKSLALEKAKVLSADSPRDAYILGADTVVFFNEKILGKPADAQEAFQMIKMIQGKTHDVHTGIALIQNERNISDTLSVKTKVCFAPMDDEEIKTYLNTNEWKGKAGAYGIQGYASQFIRGIQGDYYNVMGLPLQELYTLLKKYKIGM